KQDSTAELRPVKTGQRQGDQVVVDHGLAAGERVVVAGHIGVMPGAKVHVEEQAARSAAVAPAAVTGGSEGKSGGKS
ncbi:MAG TPA: efflux RND transporter periplasmic adaptor subunit, partial [Thermoanaerobaculia bacterium]|nr:efflux RND transporter periplasmic adaptor subunit [Thermoanaerobaculia bacterium]